jgi:hypothetical protein
MASIADLLGIEWTPLTEPIPAPVYRLGYHAQQQVRAKEFDRQAVLDAANNPSHTYENGRYAGQMRHIRGNICAVVDPATCEIVTVYANVEVTSLRTDQRRDRDRAQRADALRFEEKRTSGFYDRRR